MLRGDNDGRFEAPSERQQRLKAPNEALSVRPHSPCAVRAGEAAEHSAGGQYRLKGDQDAEIKEQFPANRPHDVRRP